MEFMVFFVVLILVGTSHALKCYSCIGTKDISGVDIPSVVLSLLSGLPPCTRFNPDDPDVTFIKECPLLNDKSCVKITDPSDSKNQIRGCFPLTKTDECSSPFCYCGKDLCNDSGRVWPSPVLLLAAALFAALARAAEPPA